MPLPTSPGPTRIFITGRFEEPAASARASISTSVPDGAKAISTSSGSVSSSCSRRRTVLAKSLAAASESASAADQVVRVSAAASNAARRHRRTGARAKRHRLPGRGLARVAIAAGLRIDVQPGIAARGTTAVPTANQMTVTTPPPPIKRTYRRQSLRRPSLSAGARATHRAAGESVCAGVLTKLRKIRSHPLRASAPSPSLPFLAPAQRLRGELQVPALKQSGVEAQLLHDRIATVAFELHQHRAAIGQRHIPTLEMARRHRRRTAHHRVAHLVPVAETSGPSKLVPVFGCVSTCSVLVAVRRSTRMHLARLHIEPAQHVAGPPEVVGHRFAAGNLPRGPQQQRPCIIDEHEHPHGADLIADDLRDLRMRRDPSLEQIAALGILLDLRRRIRSPARAGRAW